MENQFIRKALWYSAWLIWLPALGYSIGTGQIGFGIAALSLALPSLWFSLQKSVCPNCNQTIRTISYKIMHCPKCGNPLDDLAT